MNRIIFLWCLLWVGTKLLLAGSLHNPGSAFLKIGLGARPVGMGGAYVAVADNADAIFWNPAGLSQIDDLHFSFTHVHWFQQIQYEALNGAQALSNQLSFGLGLQFLHTSGIERRFTENDIEPVNTFSSGQFAAKIALAGRLPAGFGWGVSGNLIQQQIDYQNAVGGGMDVGLLSNFANSGFRAGVVVQNLGSKLKFVAEEFELPLTMRIGASKSIVDQKFLISGQASFLRYFLPRYQVGSEVCFDVGHQLNPVAFLFRVGYRWQQEEKVQSGYSAGLGIKFPYGNLTCYLDYAYQPFGFLGETHQFSLNMRFNEEIKVDVQASPASFSPNDDGYLDETDLAMFVENLKYPRKWKLTIFDSQKQPVKNFEESSLPPASVIWDGTDDFGNGVPDGQYTYRLSVTREDGEVVMSALKPLEVDLQGPLVDAFAQPDYILLDRKQRRPTIRFELEQYRRLDEVDMERLKRWKLDVFDVHKRVVKSFSQKGHLSESVTWKRSEREQLNQQETIFFYQLTAWDMVNNQGESSVKQITIKQEDASFSQRYQFTIDNVMFDTDQATLRPDGIQALQQIVRILQANPSSHVHVEGHTDNRGTDEYNMALSLARANTVSMYLMQQANLPPDHITVVPYGETRPRATNTSEVGMQLNRRVEIYIFVKD